MSKHPTKLQEKVNYSLTVVVLVLFFILPFVLCALFYLSQVPDVTWGGIDSPAYTRIWMYRERRPIGIGYESRRIVAEYDDTEICVENRLRFFLWGTSHTAEPATKQQRMLLVDNRWQPTGQTCE